MNTIELTERVTAPLNRAKLSASAQFNEWDINSLIDLIIKQYHFHTRENVVVIYDLAQKAFFPGIVKNILS